MRTAFFIIILFISAPCFSDEIRWYDGFFIETSLHHFFVPTFLSEYVKTKPGFRGALGYDYRHFRFALESGYTGFDGINPLVQAITMASLALKFGYEFPIKYGFGVQADVLAGYFLSKIVRYSSAIDVLLDNLQKDNESNLFAGIRAYATWTIRENFLKIYAGGGVEFIIEPDGPISMPLIEAGVSFKPFMLFERSEKRPADSVFNRSFRNNPARRITNKVKECI
jgi:hypothetical protein